MSNSLNICADCNNGINNENDKSDNVSQDQAERNAIIINNEIKRNNAGRIRVNEIKCKGQIDEIKYEGVVRLFAVNFNGFGSFRQEKQSKLKKKVRIGELMEC